jgi:hypothetical protein
VRWSDGSIKPEQLWYTARDQGRVAGRVLSGEPAQYTRGVWYNSAKLMDAEYTTAGQLEGDGVRTYFFEENGRVRSTTRIAHVDERVIGFSMIGRRWDHSIFIEWIEQRRALKWVLAHLNDARFDTELVPALRIS